MCLPIIPSERSADGDRRTTTRATRLRNFLIGSKDLARARGSSNSTASGPSNFHGGQPAGSACGHHMVSRPCRLSRTGTSPSARMALSRCLERSSLQALPGQRVRAKILRLRLILGLEPAHKPRWCRALQKASNDELLTRSCEFRGIGLWSPVRCRRCRSPLALALGLSGTARYGVAVGCRHPADVVGR